MSESAVSTAGGGAPVPGGGAPVRGGGRSTASCAERTSASRSPEESSARSSSRGLDMGEAKRWDYADNVRILIAFLGSSLAIEFLGVGSLLAMGGEGALFAVVLLS